MYCFLCDKKLSDVGLGLFLLVGTCVYICRLSYKWPSAFGGGSGCDPLTVCEGKMMIIVTLKRPASSLCWHLSSWEKVCNHNCRWFNGFCTVTIFLKTEHLEEREGIKGRGKGGRKRRRRRQGERDRGNRRGWEGKEGRGGVRGERFWLI